MVKTDLFTVLSRTWTKKVAKIYRRLYGASLVFNKSLSN